MPNQYEINTEKKATKIAKAINKDVGDTVNLEINSQVVPVKVVGIYDGKVFNNGISIVVQKELLKDEEDPEDTLVPRAPVA